MNEAETRLLDTTNAIDDVLERASRYWRAEFYDMNVAQVAAERRDRAIDDVFEALVGERFSTREIATLIVDNSEFALMGFDALNTTPRSAVGRWLARWW